MEVVRTASVGTRSSIGLRLGQVLFSSASLLFMCFNDDDDFYAYTAFW
uniref:CASP-like protein n=1 Tax=Brassica oleracea var. oleracea TaxID=109376 RepID=A0A0D3AGR4_BRAOL